MNSRSLALCALLTVAACSSRGGGGASIPQPDLTRETATPISHVVILIQENRSFDNFFATYPGADGATHGKTSTGATIPLTKVPLDRPADPGHIHSVFEVEYDQGKMDGFNLIHFSKPTDRYAAYTYADPVEIAPYWTMAKRYVLADRLFQTQSSGSFTAHQDLVAGDTLVAPNHSVIDFPTSRPWGCDAPVGTVTTLISPAGLSFGKGPFPCFKYDTLATLLDKRHLSWSIYTPKVVRNSTKDQWNPFDAIDAVRNGSEWSKNVVSPETSILRDVAAGRLAAVTWVIPDHPNSDHPGTASDTGPSWVTSVVNAIGQSKFWKSTAIVVVWDDWGGWYDHVKPPQIDYQGFGFRVPMLVVSPYAKTGYISHTQYEFGSILRFTEETFALGSLGTTDARATSIGDVFDFTAPPRKFVPIHAKYSETYFLKQRPSGVPVDEE